MKRFLFLAALAALWSSCSDSDCPSDQRSAISLTAAIANVAPSPGETRTSISGTTGTASWANGDQIGAYCPQISAVDIPFTASGAGSSATWTSTPSIYWLDGTTLHKFLAYYPYASGNTNSAAVPLPALNTQTGTINPTQDFMISNNQNTLGVLRSSGPVGLTFTHALTLIQLNIQLGGGVSAGTTLTNFVLAGNSADKIYTTDTSSTIALATGAITAGATTNTATITPATPPTLTTSPTQFYALILPGTYLASTLTITFVDNGTTYTTSPIALGTLIFLSGTKYSYTVTISRNVITISNPTITDWTSVTGTPLNPTI